MLLSLITVAHHIGGNLTGLMESPSSIIKDTFGRPLRDLRISVIDKCNFRCPYCMPAKIYGEGYSFLPNHELLSFEEISRLIRIFAKFGLKKVRITGGEPLIRPNLETLIQLVSAIKPSLDISLTTNGYLLKDKAVLLKQSGLHRLTVSLDTLDDEIFKKMNGRDVSVSKVITGIKAAEDAGFFPIKINAVVHYFPTTHSTNAKRMVKKMDEMQTPMKEKKASKRRKLPIIDCDIHNTMPSDMVLYPYLSQRWRRHHRQQIGTQIQTG